MACGCCGHKYSRPVRTTVTTPVARQTRGWVYSPRRPQTPAVTPSKDEPASTAVDIIDSTVDEKKGA